MKTPQNKPKLVVTPELIAGPWTQFFDMHSGGGQKLNWTHIFIQAPQEEAVKIFEQRFGRDPSNVTCECCGEDYSVTEAKDLIQATGYERNCPWDGGGFVEKDNPRYVKYGGELQHPTPLEEYINSDGALVIPRP
jgi:hypothetical protein